MKKYVLFKEYATGERKEFGRVEAASVIEARKAAFTLCKEDVLGMKYKVGAVTVSAWKKFS